MSEKVYIVYAPGRYPYHKSWADMLQKQLIGKDVEVSRVDIDGGEKLHKYFLQFREADPEVIFDFDMVGFAAGSETGECAYTTLYAKIACVLQGIKKEYREYLKKKQSLNMFFYETEETAVSLLLEKYPDMPGLAYCGKVETGEAFSFIQRHLSQEALVSIF